MIFMIKPAQVTFKIAFMTCPVTRCLYRSHWGFRHTRAFGNYNVSGGDVANGLPHFKCGDSATYTDSTGEAGASVKRTGNWDGGVPADSMLKMLVMASTWWGV